MKKLNKKITAKEFDDKFENEDVSSYLDQQNISINKEIKRINVDIPMSLLNKIDKEAKKIGVARTALIKIWLAERLNYI